MSKFFSEAIYIVPGAKRPFHSKKDAMYFCADNGIDAKRMEKYDSGKEYQRYLELSEMQRNGEICKLRRQVEYEIIPEHSEMVHVKDKIVKTYWVAGAQFETKGSALEFCRDNGIRRGDITSFDTIVPVMKKHVIEQRAVYTADFVYVVCATNEEIVEDVKSDYTRKEKDYVLRRKLMLHVHGIRVKES